MEWCSLLLYKGVIRSEAVLQGKRGITHSTHLARKQNCAIAQFVIKPANLAVPSRNHFPAAPPASAKYISATRSAITLGFAPDKLVSATTVNCSST